MKSIIQTAYAEFDLSLNVRLGPGERTGIGLWLPCPPRQLFKAPPRAPQAVGSDHVQLPHFEDGELRPGRLSILLRTEVWEKSWTQPLSCAVFCPALSVALGNGQTQANLPSPHIPQVRLQ